MELFDYQTDAIKKMKNGCILNGGVGSGKSITAIAYYFFNQGGELEPYFQPMSDDENLQDLYIITTAHKRDTMEWEGDLNHFLISPDPDLNLCRNKVVIDSWNNIKKYEDVTNAFFIFDEQRVCGWGAWSRTFIHIAKQNNWVLLSATPADKWEDYIPVFLANGFYRNKTEFRNEHLVYSQWTKYPKVERYLDTTRLIRLRNSILVDMDFKRRTVSNHIDIWCDFDISLYKRIVKDRWNPWEEKPIKNASEFCYSLRKVVNSDMSRQIKVRELFKQHKRLIIFYNYDYELELLKDVPFGDKVEVAEWNGHAHNPIPECDSWVYLVNYNAGSEGWNCIKTDAIAFYSQNYSYRTTKQACGRIDRLNTPYEQLYYYHLKSRSGIDVAISKALSNKKKFNEGKFVGQF